MYFQYTKYQELYIKSYVVVTHKNRLIETILMSTYNIGFGREFINLECHRSVVHGAL